MTTSPTHAPDAQIDCSVYRCSRQDQMYVYLRADLTEEQLPQDLRTRLGNLAPVMQLTLNAQRRLARADVEAVMQQLREVGWYLQLPPKDQINPHLHFGD